MATDEGATKPGSSAAVKQHHASPLRTYGAASKVSEAAAFGMITCNLSTAC